MGHLEDRRRIGRGQPRCFELPHVADNLTQRAAALQKLGDERVEGVRGARWIVHASKSLERAGITPPPRPGHIDDTYQGNPAPRTIS